jgi:hypothetical protein
MTAAPVPADHASPARRRALAIALGFVFGALFVERLSAQTVFDPDGYHQMALYRQWLRSGSLPVRDPFAFTHTIVPSVQHEWGAGAVLYALATWFGAPGVMLARWLISAAVAVVASRTAARRASAAVVAFCAPAAILLGQPAFTTIRAGLYTALSLVILLAAIDRDRDQARAGRFCLVYLPVVALWINLHAGWVVGVGAVGLHAIEQALRGRPVRHLLLALAATPLLMAATPYGRDYFIGWWRSISFPRGEIGEWAPLWQSHYLVGLVAFGWALLLLLYALARRGPRALPGLSFVLVAALGAWRHERHVALFALAWFCALPGYLAPTPLGLLIDAWAARRRVGALLIVGALAVGVGFLAVAARRGPFRLRLPAQGSDLGTEVVVYPAGAVEYLRAAQFRGRLVTSFINGGFVIWKLSPAVRVSFDGRYEVAYAPEVLREDRTLHRAQEGWREILARYAPDAVLVRRDEPLAAALPGGSGLARVYRDDAYEVWARPTLVLPVTTRTGVIPAAFP